MTKTKTCTMCGEEKPATVEYFYKRGNGFHSRCKVCRKAHYEANKEKKKAYYEANKEAIAKYKKAYYEANKETYAERGKAWREANKERSAKRDKAYREANKEVIAERKRAHYEANKETLLERHKAYYYRDPRRKWTIIKAAAKRRNINFSLPFELYETQLWGKPCHYCGCGLEVTGLDRKDSSKGYSRDNVVPCCGLCNIKKNTKPYEQFIQEQKESRGS